jgi:hypothetical protein
LSAASPCAGCGGAVATGRVLRVHSEQDLHRLARTWNRYDRIDLVTERLDANERGFWERRLLASYAECGCDAGAIAVLLTLAVFVLVAITMPGERSWTTVGLGVATIFTAALVGKIAGVAFARLRLRKDVRRLSARLK